MEFSAMLLDTRRGKNRKISKIIEAIVKEVMMTSRTLKGSSQEHFTCEYFQNHCVRPIFFHTQVDEIFIFINPWEGSILTIFRISD